MKLEEMTAEKVLKSSNIKKKAWLVNISPYIDVDYYTRECTRDSVCYGDTRTEAIKRFLVCNSGVTDESGVYLKVKDCKINRSSTNDIIVCEFNGKQYEGLYRDVYDRIQRQIEISKLDDNETYVIRDTRDRSDFGILMWADKGNGYTRYLENAWKLTGKEIKCGRFDRQTDIFYKLSDCVQKQKQIVVW